MTPTPTTSGAYIAWWRANRRDPWQQAATGATEADALNAMLNALAGRRGGESIVLPRTRHPNQTAARGRVR